jgi:hypothetical protein
MARRAVLIQIDPALLARLDAFAAAWTRRNRSAAIAQAVEQMLAADAQHRQQLGRREPALGGWLPGPRRTADTTVEAGSRPLTADLMDRG